MIEECEDELLVYDREHKRAHCIGATAARVWRACDGKTDVDGLSRALDLSRDTVLRALDDLEASELLDLPELQVVNGNGNGNGLTRRELAWRSAKVGAAAATVPLVYSIAVPSAMAQASPTNFQCSIFTVDSCGSSKGGGAVSGCCCCCQGCGDCKVAGSCSMCSSLACPSSCSSPQHCSSGSCSGSTMPATPQGCCGITGATSCGCAFAVGQTTTTTCGPASPGCTNPCTPGAPGCGAGCCDTSKCAGPGMTNCSGCNPGVDGTCVPCCNGTPITSSAAFGCCTPGPATTC